MTGLDTSVEVASPSSTLQTVDLASKSSPSTPPVASKPRPSTAPVVIVEAVPAVESESEEEYDEAANEAAYHARRRGNRMMADDPLDREVGCAMKCQSRTIAIVLFTLVAITLVIGVVYIQQTHEGGVKGFFESDDSTRGALTETTVDKSNPPPSSPPSSSIIPSEPNNPSSLGPGDPAMSTPNPSASDATSQQGIAVGESNFASPDQSSQSADSQSRGSTTKADALPTTRGDSTTSAEQPPRATATDP